MKLNTNKNRIKSLVVITLTAAMACAAQSSTINGGFEAGGFSPWTITIPFGTSEFNGQQAAGSASILSTWTPAAVSPVEGNNMLVLGTSPSAYFTGALTYDITARQTISLNGGDTLSGWALFFNGDFAPQDSAWVKILNNVGMELDVPWQEYSGGISSMDPNSVPYESATDWTSWQWTAPSDGDYTVVLGMTTQGDDIFASYGMFDDIRVTSIVPVPEPSTWALFGTGLLGLAGLRKKPRR